MTATIDMKFTTWQEAAQWAAEMCWFGSLAGSADPISYYLDGIDALMLEPPDFASIAAYADGGYHASTGVALSEGDLVDLLASKQRDYGHDNILRYGIEGIKVRISDKVCRLRNLTSRGIEASNEAIEDSWRDIAGYAVIGLMLESHVFELPLSEDVACEAQPSDEGLADYLSEVYGIPGWARERIDEALGGSPLPLAEDVVEPDEADATSAYALAAAIEDENTERVDKLVKLGLSPAAISLAIIQVGLAELIEILPISPLVRAQFEVATETAIAELLDDAEAAFRAKSV